MNTLPTPALALCPPAARSLLIATWIGENREPYTEVLPVLALLAQTNEDGNVELEPVVCDEEDGVTDLITALDLRRYKDAYTRMVVCSWPTDEDDHRLPPIIEKAQQRAVELERSLASSRAKREKVAT